MSAAAYNLVLEAGVDYPLTITWKDSTGALVNLTGFTGKMQIRTGAGGTVLLEKSTAGATMVLGGALGTIAFTITGADATTLVAQTVPMKWDLLLTSPTAVGTRLVEGFVTSKPAITV